MPIYNCDSARIFEEVAEYAEDTVTVEGDPQQGKELLAQVMRNGRRLEPAPSLDEVRCHAAAELAQLPQYLRELAVEPPYPVTIAPALKSLTNKVDLELEKH